MASVSDSAARIATQSTAYQYVGDPSAWYGSTPTARLTKMYYDWRDRLVAAAVELFYRNGYGAVGIDRVIAHAGVTKTTFYKHFEGKDEWTLRMRADIEALSLAVQATRPDLIALKDDAERLPGLVVPLNSPLKLIFCSSNSTPASTGVRGVRSSCPSTARNRSLARFAASASARASRSRKRFCCCSRARLCAVMS